MATWDKQSNEYNLHMSVNILYRVLIFTSSGFPNGKMKLLVGKFLEKVANFGDHALKMFSIVKNVLFCHVCFVLFFSEKLGRFWLEWEKLW